MAKSSGGAGRIGRSGRVQVAGTGADRPGSIANILRERVANRVNLPKPIEARASLEFGRNSRGIEGRNPASIFTRQRNRPQDITVGFPSGTRATPRINPLGRR